MSRSIYLTRRWRDRVRPAQLRREPLCRAHQARGRVVQATEVDHIKRISEGGDPWDENNLQSLCHDCHSSKTASDKTGKPMGGCDVHGIPLDPRHHWRKGKHAHMHAPESAR